MPTGFTTYTNFSPNGNSFGFVNKGNDGIKTKANWGAGDVCAQCYLDNSDYNYSIMAIGLSLVNHEKAIANGNHDKLIQELGQWIKNSKRPTFLRVGYEFDGWSWNHYNRKEYLLAWQRIRSVFKEMKVDNVAFVWQSKGTASNQKVLEKWYPGDDLVDWCGYSYFGNSDEEMLIFARKHNKPVFIAEATPISQNGNLYFNANLSEPEVATRIWENWFVPFLNTLNNNKDIIKAFSYINSNWKIQPMWTRNPTFQKVDSRIQESAYISKKWKEEITKSRYLKPDSGLWDKLSE
jgi:hypothetical protein